MSDDVYDVPVQSDGTTTENSPTYCTVDDVAIVLQKPVPSEHTDEGEPSKSDWQKAILWAEGEIDRATNNSWRPRRSGLEFHDFDSLVDKQGFLMVDLDHRSVRPFDSGKGDLFEVWDGDSYEDWLSTKTQGRAEDWWIQEPAGYLYVKRGIFPVRLRDARIRVSYRYGQTRVPHDVERATAELAATVLDRGMKLAPGGAPNQNLDAMTLVDQHSDELKTFQRIVNRHAQAVGGY